jgi:D-alanine-D-alanine ligase-like ATP-grasp enzyme
MRAAITEASDERIVWREQQSKSTPELLLDTFIACLTAYGSPEIGVGAVVSLPSEGNNQRWRLQIPIASYVGREQYFRLTVNALVSGANALLGEALDLDGVESIAATSERARNAYNQFMQQLKYCVPGSKNRRELVRSAHILGIPWRELAPSVYQFGWGKHSRLLDSTHTDNTSVIATTLAKNKRACSDFLRAMGFPVVTGALGRDLQSVTRAASAIGYPVVLKPSAADGGESVFTGLANEADVRWAFEQMDANFLPAVVESYFEGRDYRLHVWHNEIAYVVERTPAHIVGDGISSVEALVTQLNKKRQRQDLQATGEFAEVGTKPIVLDGESARWLERQELNTSSVPAMGRIIRLKGAANVSKGGTRRKVPLSEVHPDNILLVTNAVRAMRLDVAGVDLLIPDIGISWLSSGASICEINSQPQLFEGFDELLQLMVANTGRIETTLVVAYDSLTIAAAAFSEVLARNDRFAAVAAPGVFLMDGVPESQADVTQDKDLQLRLARRALSDYRVEHLVYLISPHQLHDALPFNSVNYLCIESGMLREHPAEVAASDDRVFELDSTRKSTDLPVHIAWLCKSYTTVLVTTGRSERSDSLLNNLIQKFESFLKSM